MEQILKTQIATGAAEYAKLNGLSNNDVAKATGVNAGYISNIFRNQFTVEVNDKPTPIGDTQFYKLAEWAGIAVKKEYWQFVQTLQSKETLGILLDSKKDTRAFIIVNDTGLGKTTAINVFTNKYPQHTYKVTVGYSYKLEDIINELSNKIGIDVYATDKRLGRNSINSRLAKITAKLIEIKHAGGNPVIILDEAENLKVAVLQTIKELYDAIIDYCSIVLIGTEQILESMLNTRTRNRRAVPQLYRRFKAGIRIITPLNKARDFAPFYEFAGVDKTTQKMINGLAENYGELHDYLEPVLRHADEKQQPLTADLFRLYHNIQTAI